MGLRAGLYWRGKSRPGRVGITDYAIHSDVVYNLINESGFQQQYCIFGFLKNSDYATDWWTKELFDSVQGATDFSLLRQKIWCPPNFLLSE